jgi:hypothetical protein
MLLESLDQEIRHPSDSLFFIGFIGVEIYDSPAAALCYDRFSSSSNRFRASMMAATPLELTISPHRIRLGRSSMGTLSVSTSSCSSGFGGAVASTPRARKR